MNIEEILSDRAWKVYVTASEVARHRRDDKITPEHLLWAVGLCGYAQPTYADLFGWIDVFGNNAGFILGNVSEIKSEYFFSVLMEEQPWLGWEEAGREIERGWNKISYGLDGGKRDLKELLPLNIESKKVVEYAYNYARRREKIERDFFITTSDLLLGLVSATDGESTCARVFKRCGISSSGTHETIEELGV